MWQRWIGVVSLAVVPAVVVMLWGRPVLAGGPPQGDTPKCLVRVEASTCNNAPAGQFGCYQCDPAVGCEFLRRRVTDWYHCQGQDVWITAVIMGGACPDIFCGGGLE